MLCQNCQKRTANVHFTQVVNNNKKELYLCEQCANEKGKMGFSNSLNLDDFLSGFIGYNYTPSRENLTVENIVCKKCGMSYEDFQKCGKLGCADCYDLFKDRVAPLLKRIHGSAHHHGKLPRKASEGIKATKEIEKLKAELNEAVQKEYYEKAAKIRDRIKVLEAGKEG